MGQSKVHKFLPVRKLIRSPQKIVCSQPAAAYHEYERAYSWAIGGLRRREIQISYFEYKIMFVID